MNKAQERELVKEIVKEVLIEEGVIGNLAGAVVTGQIGNIIKDTGSKIYDSTIGVKLSQIDRWINKKINALTTFGQSEITNMRVIVEFALNYNSAGTLGHAVYNKQLNRDNIYFTSPKGKKIWKLITDTGVQQSNIIGDIIQGTFLNANNYDVMRIAKDVHKKLNSGKKTVRPKPGTSPKTGKIFWNDEVFTVLENVFSESSNTTLVGKNINILREKMLKKTLKQLPDLAKSIAKHTKTRVGNVIKDPLKYINKVTDPNIDKAIDKIDSEFIERLVWAVLSTISSKEYAIRPLMVSDMIKRITDAIASGKVKLTGVSRKRKKSVSSDEDNVE